MKWRLFQKEKETNSNDDTTKIEVQSSFLDDEVEPRASERPVWSNRAEFLLAATGYAVGFGNVFRFPWLLMKNGGGAFLIPYFVMLVLEGIPMFCLEFTLGQRHHLGPIPLWRKLSPFSAGIGVSQFFFGIMSQSVYYSLVAWSVYYFAISFQSPLPFSACPKGEAVSHLAKGTNTSLCNKIGPTVYYWYHDTLQISDGFGEDVTLSWKLTLCVLAVGIITFLCLIKGVKSTGKVVYFTATFPYVVLLIYLTRGLMLEGSSDGLKFLFSFKFHRLADPYVWLQAAGQVFYSLSLGSGGMMTYASYNPTHQNIFIDVITISLINCSTSLIAGLAVYSLLGHRAHILLKKCQSQTFATLTQISGIVNNTLHSKYQPSLMNSTAIQQVRDQLQFNISRGFDIQECSTTKILEQTPSGSGLAFITLTEVITQLPGANFFSVMFFLMLITLGLDSIFGGAEGLIASVMDSKRFSRSRHEIVVAIICTIVTLAGFPFVTQSGEYFLQLIYTYALDISLATISFLEIITVVYLYGLNRLVADIKIITGKKVGVVFKVLWCFVSPALLFALLLITIVKFSQKGGSHYQLWNWDEGTLTKEVLPRWGVAIGWIVLIVQLIWIPFFAIKAMITSRRKQTLSEKDENKYSLNPL